MREEYFTADDNRKLRGTIYREKTLKRVRKDGTRIYHTRYVAEMSVSSTNVVRFRSTSLESVRQWIKDHTAIINHQKKKKENGKERRQNRNHPNG